MYSRSKERTKLKMLNEKRGRQKMEESTVQVGAFTKRGFIILILSTLIIATIGALLQIGGISWDIMSHGLGAPETFFTAPHDILYTGIILVAISIGLLGTILLKNRELRSKSLSTGFKLMMIGVCLDLVAGPSDFMWHEAFGLDGLLSPPHLTLITWMLLSSLGITITLVGIANYIPNKQQWMVKATLVPAFAALWFTCTWYINWFTLPFVFQNGEMFNFMLDPLLASMIAVIATPLVSSLVFITASKTIRTRRFGAASSIVALVVFINTFANIVPANGILLPSIPSYLISAIVPAVIADIVLNKLRTIKFRIVANIESNTMISGAIIGSVFYFIGFPMLVWTFAEPLIATPFDSMTQIMPNFLDTLSVVLAFTLGAGAVIGVLGEWISSKITNRISA
jgi:hypothetical protein